MIDWAPINRRLLKGFYLDDQWTTGQLLRTSCSRLGVLRLAPQSAWLPCPTEPPSADPVRTMQCPAAAGAMRRGAAAAGPDACARERMGGTVR
eukprot:364353-Chlamydomonas_euryale.AAC.7